MYQASLFFKIKDAAALKKHRILELFFKSWIDDTCQNEVEYTLMAVEEAAHGSFSWVEIYRVDFERPEDVVALKLAGIPLEFQKYIELIP